jgi:hypothetical protein
MERLVSTKNPIEELANSILSVLVVSTVELSQGMVQGARFKF